MSNRNSLHTHLTSRQALDKEVAEVSGSNRRWASTGVEMGMQDCGKLRHHQRQHSSVMPVVGLSAWSLSSELHVAEVDANARSLYGETKLLTEVQCASGVLTNKEGQRICNSSLRLVKGTAHSTAPCVMSRSEWKA